MRESKSFSGEYAFLSNMFPCNIEFPIFGKVVKFTSAEAAFQAGKALGLEDIEKIASAKSGYEAKKIGRHIKIQEDWDGYRLGWMEYVLRQKFSHQNLDLRQKLIDTYPMELIENNTWNDTFWGKCDGKGENHLGKILEKIRLDLTNSK